MNTRVCAASFHHAETPEVQSSNRKTTITENNFQHCHGSFSSFLSQLYYNFISLPMLFYAGKVLKKVLEYDV